MASVMATHFKPYGWICRAVGLFFLQGLQSGRVQDVRVAWRTWYTLYALACLLCFTAVETAIAVANVIRLFFRVRSFTKSLILVRLSVIAVRVAINEATAIFGTRGMVEFFKKSAEYEQRTGFKREHHRYRCRISFLLRNPDKTKNSQRSGDLIEAINGDRTVASALALTNTKRLHFVRTAATFYGSLPRARSARAHNKFVFVIAFCAHTAVNTNTTMRMVDVADSQFLEFVLKAGILLFSSLFFVYDVLHFVVLRPCCDVLVSYIRHQRVALRTTLETGHGFTIAKLTGADDGLEAVRINLCSIGNLKRVINDTWQFSIMASATVILIVSCICIYCVFDKGVSTHQLMLTMTYCFYSVIDFADVAWLSQKMSNEVRELKEYLMKVSMFREPPQRCGQVAYLHNSIHPEEMFLTGGNYFKLNLPLLVSLAGSIITYSVILVQTSDSVNNLALPKSNHTGVP